VLQRAQRRRLRLAKDGPLALVSALAHLDRVANGARDRQA
jgi:hypothetical protein